MGKEVIKSFIVRALSGVALFILVLLSLLSVYSFIALTLIIAIGSLLEFYKMARIAGYKPMVKYGVAATTIMVLLNAFVAVEWLPIGTLAVISLVLFIPFVIELYNKAGNPFVNISISLMGIIYIGVPISLIYWITMGDLVGGSLNNNGILSGLNISMNQLYHPEIILSCLFLIWANDIGAYIVGVTIGKHKLFKRISPKKSWEGLFGGVVIAIAVGILAGYLMESSLIKWGLLGLVVSVSGVYGDLIESMFKRSAGVKDSGNIMPGHGGFLDRFDALFFAMPFIFIYFIIFVIWR